MSHGPKGIKVMLEIGLPPSPMPQKEKAPDCPKAPVEEQVREAIELIDSGFDSEVEWLMLNRLYDSICKLKKPTPRAMNVKKMIEPVLARFGYHKVTSKG